MMDSNTDSLRVLIVGAGSAGLLTALALKKVGIACTVFEQDTSFAARPRDWNFGVYWAQSRLRECIPDEVASQIESIQTDPSYKPNAESIMPIYNGQTGDLMKEIPTPWSIRIHRRRWLKLLSNGVDVKYGKRLKTVETSEHSVTVTFEDGTTETGSVLVGAEGAHSLTREFLLGPVEAALLPSPVVASATITTLNREVALALRALHEKNAISFHPRGIFTWMSIHDCSSDNPEQWTWMLIQSWRADEPTGLSGDSILEYWWERGKEFAYPFSGMLAATPAGTKIWHSRLSYWPTKPWDSHGGLVTLVGDAAHPMTFHRGQGLNNAITDVAELLAHLQNMKELTAEEVRKAILAYEKDLWPRGREAVLDSNRNTNVVHDWSTLMQSPLFTGGMARDTNAPKADEVEAAEAA